MGKGLGFRALGFTDGIYTQGFVPGLSNYVFFWAWSDEEPLKSTTLESPKP